MLVRSAVRAIARPVAVRPDMRPRTSTRAALRSASLFTASIGLGTCPKRRSRQSNEESGEDAYFINAGTAEGGKVWAGVFDGVGGWADMGVDPSIFSAGLARHCDAASERTPGATPVAILVAGYDAVQGDVGIKLGSSTACVASVDLGRGELRVANLGDSGYLILNLAGQVVHASRPQTYFFNAPYQLAKMPDSMRRPGSLENRPTDAAVSTHQLHTDEVVILATDGFFDNIFPTDAAKMVSAIAAKASRTAGTTMTKQDVVDEIAGTLTESARSAGRSRKNGPFAEEARMNNLQFTGGKEDDICLVVIALDDAVAAGGRPDVKAKL